MPPTTPAPLTVTGEPPQHVLRWEPSGITMVFRLIEPKAPFLMGSRGFWPDETPPHLVRIPHAFWLAETPVTQEQFALWTKFAGTAHENGIPGHPDHPAENLTWREAIAYCDWLTRHPPSPFPLGFQLTCLPTEAEWEFACRGGTDTEYYTGDGEAALAQAGWFDGNSQGTTQTVRQKKANKFGLYDLHGNVWEWCHDVWDDAAFRSRVDGDEDPGSRVREKDWRSGLKMMQDAKDARVVRGGSWDNSARNCRSAFRDRGTPDARFRISGFRVCLVPGPASLEKA